MATVKITLGGIRGLNPTSTVLFNKNNSRNINERQKQYVYSLKSTNFLKSGTLSGTKPVFPATCSKLIKPRNVSDSHA